jgi:hypothetical protein
VGLPAGSGGRWLRRSAAALTTAGLLAAITATALAGTGRLDPHGMIAIPALHNPRQAHHDGIDGMPAVEYVTGESIWRWWTAGGPHGRDTPFVVGLGAR